MEYGVIKRIVVGPAIFKGGVMNYQLNHNYNKDTIVVDEITEEIVDGIHWVSVFVVKKDDNEKRHYLWWRISNTYKIQYLLDI